ncbi:MAG: hypothetical protein ACRC67_33290 [Inquilinus sp.]|uniref:hypothetical protein n=1 Tax=Inquilinus sp. TaxID=1932117 RepID=UPI003F39BBA9
MTDLFTWLNQYPSVNTLIAAVIAASGVLIAATLAFWAAWRNGKISLRQVTMQIEAQERARAIERETERAKIAIAFAAEFLSIADAIKSFKMIADFEAAAVKVAVDPGEEMPKYRTPKTLFTMFTADPIAFGMFPPEISHIAVRTFHRANTMFAFITEGSTFDFDKGPDRAKELKLLATNVKAVEADCRDVAKALEHFAAQLPR